MTMRVWCKRAAYIGLFVFLGFLAQLLVHALVEIVVLHALSSDVPGEEFRISWETWRVIHRIGTAVLLVAGLSLGVWQGRYWWPRLYDEQGVRRKRV